MTEVDLFLWLPFPHLDHGPTDSTKNPGGFTAFTCDQQTGLQAESGLVSRTALVPSEWALLLT